MNRIASPALGALAATHDVRTGKRAQPHVGKPFAALRAVVAANRVGRAPRSRYDGFGEPRRHFAGRCDRRRRQGLQTARRNVAHLLSVASVRTEDETAQHGRFPFAP